MSSPEERWWSVRAGEYVLGTLRGEDLALFERILSHDTEMCAEVARWERRLGPLYESARESPPGDRVWRRVLERIRGSDGAPSETELEARDVVIGTVATPGSEGTTDSPRDGRPSRLWPVVAGLATAASLVLGLLVGLLLYQRAESPGRAPLQVDGLAVVLSDEDGEPYFLVETDYGNLRVRVTALTPPSLEENRNFQLWQALPDRSAVRPVALLPEASGGSQVFDVGSLIEGSDLFGVSIEPEGAPTDAGPTGPVVAHGDFLLRADPD